jgi:hypothetical protein
MIHGNSKATIQNLPELRVHGIGTPAWDGIDRLKIAEVGPSSIVRQQPRLELVPTRENGRHRLGVAFKGLVPDRIYRATAWVKINGHLRIMLDVRDGAHARQHTASFDPGVEGVKRRASANGSNGSGTGDEWSCASLDVSSTDGVVVVYVGLADRANSATFEGRDDMQFSFGGIDLAPLTETNGRQSARPAASKPRLICVGAGRDGTQSLYRMIQTVFDGTDGRSAMHEYCSREFYQAFCSYQETGDVQLLDEIRRMIVDCPYDCIVGNGYAAILPLFREVWGPDTRLLHLRRADRDACIESMVKNASLFPGAYLYYSSSEEAKVKRMAAFHFGEMPINEWNQLCPDKKFGWFYDKTHALVDLYKNLFAGCIELSTEQLGAEEGCRTVARWAADSEAVVPTPTHLNAHSIDISAAAKEHREKLFWLMGRLNVSDLCRDDVYAIDYFVNNFIAWTGYQIKNSPQLGASRRPAREETAKVLARANAILRTALTKVDGLADLNLKNRGQSSSAQADANAELEVLVGKL